MGLFLNHTLDVGGAQNLNDLLLYLGELQDVPTYRRAFDILSPEVYLAPLQVAMYAGEEASKDVLDCHFHDGSAAAVMAENSCVWFRVDAAHLDRSDTVQQLGFLDQASGLRGGAQVHLGGPWSVGLVVGHESHQLAFNTVPAHFNGELTVGAAALKWQQGPSEVSLSVAGGAGHFHSTRFLSLDAPGLMNPNPATADPSVGFIQVDLRASKDFNFGALNVKPEIDLNQNNEHMGAFVEANGGAVASQSPGGWHHGFTAKPDVLLSYDILSGQTVLRPYIAGGIAWRPDARFALPFAFVGSIPQAGTYTQDTRVDPLSGTFEVGLSLTKLGAFSISAAYQGEYSKNYTHNAGMMRAAIQF
jgi:hypothetical protein